MRKIAVAQLLRNERRGWERRGEEKKAKRGKNQGGGVGQDRDPIINREQRKTVLSGNPELPQKPRRRRRGWGHLFTSVFSHAPLSPLP